MLLFPLVKGGNRNEEQLHWEHVERRSARSISRSNCSTGLDVGGQQKSTFDVCSFVARQAAFWVNSGVKKINHRHWKHQWDTPRCCREGDLVERKDPPKPAAPCVGRPGAEVRGLPNALVVVGASILKISSPELEAVDENLAHDEHYFPTKPKQKQSITASGPRREQWSHLMKGHLRQLCPLWEAQRSS